MELEYDIFISYPHEEEKNSRELEKNPWVNAFCTKLKSKFHRLTGKPLSVFLDEDVLRAGEALNEKIEDGLRNALLFVPVLSPSYFESDWCIKEFNYFLEVIEKQALGEKRTNRIIPIVITPYDKESLPDSPEVRRIAEALEEPVFIRLYDELKDPLPYEDKHYKEKLKEVVETARELKLAFRQNTVAPKNKGKGIFLGISANSLEPDRDQFIRALRGLQRKNKSQGRGFHIFPDDELSPAELKAMDKENFEKTIQGFLQRSIFSIHFFDAVYGPRPKGSKESLLHIQYEQAKKRHGDALPLPSYSYFKDVQQCGPERDEFIKQVKEDIKEGSGHFDEITLEGLDYLEATLGGKVEAYFERAEQAARKKKAGERSCGLLITNFDDDPAEIRRCTKLMESRLRLIPWYYDGDYHDARSEKDFKNALEDSSKAVILFGKGSFFWYQAIKAFIRKHYIDHAEESLKHLAAVLISAPEGKRVFDEREGHREILFPFPVIDSTDPRFESNFLRFLTSVPQSPSHA
ncbi:MAG: toll/interleukin-1 receptor domain-containing protein [Phaeodactylibacter sp.]|nr:toll/interleukin-1 receptor domain-containing protein [Phaeodactylibacter sp.]